MAFVVEDGTGLSDSNSYAAVAEADSYFADRAVSAWTGADSVKQSALVRATDYIEGRFGLKFIGSKASSSQSLSWPRTSADPFADNVIPRNLKRACFEYALRALSAELAPDLEVSASGLAIVATKKTVGPIITETQYAQSGSGSTPKLFKPYPAADVLLKELLKTSNGVIRG